MIGLIKKDLYCMKQLLRQYIWMVLFFAVFGFFMKSPSYVTFMGIIMGTSLMFASLSVDETGGFGFALTLPVSRRQVVRSKYIFLLVGLVCILVSTTVVGLIMATVLGISFSEIAFSSLYCAGFYLITMAIVVPVAFRWKVEKARLIFMGIVAIPVIAVVLIFTRMDDVREVLFEQMIEANIVKIAVVTCIIAVLGFAASYFVAVRIFEKEEF